MAKTRKQLDPLESVRIAAPKTANAPVEETSAVASDTKSTEPAVDDEAVAAAKKALKAEKKLVTPPATLPPSKVKQYVVQRDQPVFWKGQQLRLKAGRSIISDQKFGPGGVAAFQAMGVSMKEA